MPIDLRLVVAELDLPKIHRVAKARRLEERSQALRKEEDVLKKRLVGVRKDLSRLDDRISRLLSRNGARHRGGRGRGPSKVQQVAGVDLPSLVVRAFSGIGKRKAKAPELAKWIAKHYPAMGNVKHVRQRVAETLAKNRKCFRRLGRGLYTLRKSSAA